MTGHLLPQAEACGNIKFKNNCFEKITPCVGFESNLRQNQSNLTISKRILGIDPGTNVLGFAVIEIDKTAHSGMKVIEIGVVTMGHFDEQQTKLRYIFEQVQDLIRQHGPTEMAIEAPFFGKNVQSMLKLGRAQGVAIASAMTNGLEITEYSPKKIKKAVTGNGNASKEQVAGMLENILRQKLAEKLLDATDALATAVCHHYQSGRMAAGKKDYKDWKSFLKENPQKAA